MWSAPVATGAGSVGAIPTEAGSPIDPVADMGDVGRVDDPRRRELDGFVPREAEVGRVEQAHPVADEHLGDLQVQLVEQAGPDHVAQQRAAAGDRHVLPIRRRPRPVDGAVQAVGDVREAGAALPHQRFSGPMSDDEDRRVERGSSPQGTSPPSAIRLPMT